MPLSRKDTQSYLGVSQSIWFDYQQHKTSEIRNLLFEHYEPWIKNMTASLFTKYGSHKLEWSDFYTLTSWGCLVAIEKFDINFGIPFEAFAFKYLKGKVLDGIKLSSDDRDKNEKIIARDRVESITIESDDDPFDFILDAVVGLALGRFLELGIVDDVVPSINTPYFSNVESFEIKYIKQLIEKLNNEQKIIIKYHYFQRFKFTEIAELLDMTKSRISQLHKEALKNIRDMYEYHIE